jgi:hypothetical protein
MNGIRPPRPSESVDDAMWALIEQCWNSHPTLRPTVDEVVKKLASLPDNWKDSSPVHDQVADSSFTFRCTLANNGLLGLASGRKLLSEPLGLDDIIIA